MTGKELLEAFNQLSTEDQATMAAAMEQAKAEAAKPKAETRFIGEPLHGPNSNWDKQHERYLTDEEVWDRDHPLKPLLWPYGYSSTIHEFRKPERTKYYTRKEVDQHNEPIIQAWLEEKRKYFPDATLPEGLQTSI